MFVERRSFVNCTVSSTWSIATFPFPTPQAIKNSFAVVYHRVVGASILCKLYQTDSVNTKKPFLCFLCSGKERNWSCTGSQWSKTVSTHSWKTSQSGWNCWLLYNNNTETEGRHSSKQRAGNSGELLKKSVSNILRLVTYIKAWGLGLRMEWA